MKRTTNFRNRLQYYLTYSPLEFFQDCCTQEAICTVIQNCSGAGSSWGSITGTITDQADLVTYISNQIGNTDLQSATDSDNVTSNAIQITGASNISLSDNGLLLVGSSSGGELFGISGGAIVAGLSLLTQTPEAAGIQTLSRVSAADAINPQDVINLGQAQDLFASSIQNVTLASEPVGALNADTYYTNNYDIGDVEWILPPVAGNIGKRFGVINLHEVNITLNSNTGGNDIFDGGTVSSLIIPSQTSKIFYNNGGLWVALT